MVSGHGDYHPAIGHAMGPALDLAGSTPRPRSSPAKHSWSAIYNAYRSATSETGSNVWNTTLLIGWDEPGGTYDHVPPGPVPPPDPRKPAGEMGFTFDRSGYRVPAIIVSPWVDEGLVFNEEYRHTSLIATLRKEWDLGDPFTGRDAAAAPIEHLLTRDTPRDPASWPNVEPRPVAEYHMDMEVMNKAVGALGKAISSGTIEHARQAGISVPASLTDPDATSSGQEMVDFLRNVAHALFPLLAPKGPNSASSAEEG